MDIYSDPIFYKNILSSTALAKGVSISVKISSDKSSFGACFRDPTNLSLTADQDVVENGKVGRNEWIVIVINPCCDSNRSLILLLWSITPEVIRNIINNIARTNNSSLNFNEWNSS